MSATDSALQSDLSVTVNWINNVLNHIAAESSFSSLKLRTDVQARQASTDPQSDLAKILRRLYNLEAKWLVRMLLKDYGLILIPEQTIM
jgi:DNA ligase 4